MKATGLFRLESRLLLSGADDLAGDTPDLASDLGIVAIDDVDPISVIETVDQIDDRVDWYQLDLLESTTLELSLLVAGFDTNTSGVSLRLHDEPNDSELRYGVDDGSGQIELAAKVDPGTYYVRIGLRSDGAEDATYLLNLEGFDPDAVRLGTLDSRTAQSGTVGVAAGDSSDEFSFTLTQDERIAVSLARLKDDLDLSIIDSTGAVLASSYAEGTTDEHIQVTLAAGDYSLIVDSNGNASSWYRLVLVPTDVPDELDDVAHFGSSVDWGLNDVGAPEAWAQGATGQGVVVAVVDTGIDLDHSEFEGRIYVNTNEIAGNGIDDDGNGFIDDINGWDFAYNDAIADDGTGHGTHVSGILAGANDGSGVTGIAYDATILPIKVLDDDGSGSLRDIADGIIYAVGMGADIISMSLGSSGTNRYLRRALDLAENAGVLIVAAAGNDAANAPSYPAIHSATNGNVLSVGAYDQTDTISSVSNGVGFTGAVQVDAPGVDIYSAWNNGSYATISGTSMAAPVVSGIAALMLSVNPNLTATELRTLLITNTGDTISGSDAIGQVDARYAIAEVMTMPINA